MRLEELCQLRGVSGDEKEVHDFLYDEYKKRNLNSNSGNRQLYTTNEENHYTSAGFDMIDNFNQRDLYGINFPVDNVSGYNINQLQNALIGANSWNEWRDNI